MESLSLPPHTHKLRLFLCGFFFFTPLPFIPPPILTEPRGGMGTERKTIVLVVITVAHMSAQMKIQKKKSAAAQNKNPPLLRPHSSGPEKNNFEKSL